MTQGLPIRAARLVAALPMAVLLAMASPSESRADSAEAVVTFVTPSTIEVTSSDGHSYNDMIAPPALLIDIDVTLDTGATGRILSWQAIPWIVDLGAPGQINANAPFEHLGFPGHGFAESFPPIRPKHVEKSIRLSIEGWRLKNFAVAQCNRLADELRAGGMTDGEVFGQTRDTDMGVVPVLSWETTGLSWFDFNPLEQAEANRFSSVDKLGVRCKRHHVDPPTVGGETAPVGQIVNSGLAIQEAATINGACKIRLDGWMTTNFKGVGIKFFYEDDSGKKSQVWDVDTGESKTATFSHHYNITNGPGVESGAVRMVGTGDHDDYASAWVDYEMNCAEESPGQIVSKTLPKMTLSFMEKGKVMVGDQHCPASLKLIGVLDADTDYAGIVGFVSENWFAQPQDFEIAGGQKLPFGADYALDWSQGKPPKIKPNGPMQLRPRFTMTLSNEDSKLVDSLKNKVHTVKCVKVGKGTVMTPGVRLKAAPAPSTQMKAVAPATTRKLKLRRRDGNN